MLQLKQVKDFSGMRNEDVCVVFDDTNKRYYIPEGNLTEVVKVLLEDGANNPEVPAKEFLEKLGTYQEMRPAEGFFFLLETAVSLGYEG
jgi:hypothetical protein